MSVDRLKEEITKLESKAKKLVKSASYIKFEKKACHKGNIVMIYMLSWHIMPQIQRRVASKSEQQSSRKHPFLVVVYACACPLFGRNVSSHRANE